MGCAAKHPAKNGETRRTPRRGAERKNGMEHNKREKIMAYVSQYAIITLSITIMSVGVYFFKFPNNFVFGGVTGAAALVAKLTPLSASAFSSWANMILLVVGLIFLGKKICHDHRLCLGGHVGGADVPGKVLPHARLPLQPAHAGPAVRHRSAGHCLGPALQCRCFLGRHGRHCPHRGKNTPTSTASP